MLDEEDDDLEPADFDALIHELAPEDLPATLDVLRRLAERGGRNARTAAYVEKRLRRRWPEAARAYDARDLPELEAVAWDLIERLDEDELLVLLSMVASLERNGAISERQAREARWLVEAWFAVLEYDHDAVEIPL